MSGLKATVDLAMTQNKYDISGELSRTYEYRFFSENGVDIVRYLKIEEPVTLFYTKGHMFHRVWDGGEMALYHVPGPIWGSCGKIIGICVVSWVPRDKGNPCQF